VIGRGEIDLFMKSQKSRWLIVGLALFVGMLHFWIGPNYRGPFPVFVHSYLIDILLPMVLYLLCQQAFRKIMPVKPSRYVGLALPIGIGIAVEILQKMGVNFLGSTYDPWDILMYALGAMIGLGIDYVILTPWEQAMN
jgi:hypothetical protein